jgi:DNA-binding MarR family transcriptional regulator
VSPEHGVRGPDRTDDPPLEQLIGQFIHAAGLRLAAPETAPAAVSRSEARALFELLAARGIAQGEMGGLLGLEKSTVSRLAAGLERKGWVERGRDSGNQRYVRLYLTEEGRSVAARLWRGWHDRQARILGSLTEEERAGLAVGLRGLVRAICAEGADLRLAGGPVHRQPGMHRLPPGHRPVPVH